MARMCVADESTAAAGPICNQRREILRVDLHTHTSDDPVDVIPYTTADLIDCAARAGLDAIAVTLHDRQLDTSGLRAYAAARGLVLVPGVERTIEGRHVLLINFPCEAACVESREDLAELKESHPCGLVVAPHPFYPLSTCLRGWMNTHADLFDAVEVNGCYTELLNFNSEAIRWAGTHRKPVVGNSDAHSLSLVGMTSSLVEAEPNADAICLSIKRGNVRLDTRPLPVLGALAYLWTLIASGPRLRRPHRSLHDAEIRRRGWRL